MVLDPFSIKSYSKISPKRLVFTARARALDYASKRNFDAYEISRKVLLDLPEIPDGIEWSDTSVTHEQMCHLLAALHATEASSGCVIELGSYRGVTAACLATHTKRKVVVVDPFLGGWGSTNEDYDIFQKRTRHISNLAHERATSGSAATGWSHGAASLIFVDAVHDYVNTSFDIAVWWPKLERGGIIAFHDTDDRAFAGTRRAVYELYERGAELYAHVHNLTMLRLPV